MIATGSDDKEQMETEPSSSPAPRRGVSFSGPVRQLSHWSSHFRGEDAELDRPPSGSRFRRTSSCLGGGGGGGVPAAAAEEDGGRLTRSVSGRSETTSVTPAAYHSDLKADIKAPLTWSVVLATVVMVFGSSFQFGFNIGVLNPQVRFINASYHDALSSRRGSVGPQELTVLWSLTTALMIPGGLAGSLLGGWMADKFGRKRTLMFSHVFILLGVPLATGCVAARSPEMLMISRILFGFNAGLGNCAAPMFVSEISPYSRRGALSTLPQLFLTIGILMSSIFGLPQLFGSSNRWQFLFLLELIPAVTAIFAIPFLRETPRFLLLIRGERPHAQKSLEFYRKTKDVLAEMEEMDTEHRTANKTDKETAFTWKQLFTTTSLRRPLIIVVMLQIMQQFSGINAVFFYSDGIFRSAGVPEEHVPYAIVGTNFVNVVMTVITVPLIDRVGRRPLLLIPMLVMAVDLIILTVCLKLQPSYSWLGIAAVICILIYVIGFAVGLGPIPMMLAAELFRQRPRPKAMALAGIANWCGVFVIAIGFEPLKAAAGDFTFVIFSVLLLVFVVFTFLCVPETKNLTFEEIANKFCPGDEIEVEVIPEEEDGTICFDSAAAAAAAAATTTPPTTVARCPDNDPEQRRQQQDGGAVVTFDLGSSVLPMVEKQRSEADEGIDDRTEKTTTQTKL